MPGADHTRMARTSSEPGDDTGRALHHDQVTRMEEATVSVEQLEEMGPIDYIVIEWPGRQPTGDAVPLIVDLVDRGLIRVLDIAFLAKGAGGSVAALDIGEINRRRRGLGEVGRALQPPPGAQDNR